MNGEDWRNEGLCSQTDPESFYPEKGESTKDAKKICTGCEVRAQCLDYALTHDERFGVWGGLSERERNRINRQRGTSRQATTPTGGPKCGTPNGVKSHAARGERACHACLDATRGGAA